MFDTIGVTENQLQDEETSQFIYDFVEQHGGIEKATKELERSTGKVFNKRSTPFLLLNITLPSLCTLNQCMYELTGLVSTQIYQDILLFRCIFHARM